jgi:hypothetical protein
MKREMKRRRIFSIGLPHPLVGCPLLSYKRSPSSPSSHTLDSPLPGIVAAQYTS